MNSEGKREPQIFVSLQTKGALKIYFSKLFNKLCLLHTNVPHITLHWPVATGELLRDKSADPLNSSLWVIVLSLEAFRYCLFCVTDSILINPSLTDAGETVCVATYSGTSPDDSTSAAWNTSRGCVWRRWIVHRRAESPVALRNSSLEPELHLTSHSSVRPKRPSRTDHADKALISTERSGKIRCAQPRLFSTSTIYEQKWRYAQDFAYPSSTSNPYTKTSRFRSICL